MAGLLTCTSCAATSDPTQPALEPTAGPSPTLALAPPRPTALTRLPTAAPTAFPSPTPTRTPSPTPTRTPTPGAADCGDSHGTMSYARMRSAALHRVETYRVYTPACYRESADRRYPVIYLLHGGNHDEEHWDDIGVDDAADQLIVNGTVGPFLIVLPDGGQDFGPLEGDPPPFARYLHDELIPQIDASHRTLADRADRALGGISYGAAWALLLAARYPGTFSAVGAHSPAIGAFNGIYPGVPALAAGRLRIYLDVGDRDQLRAPAAAFDAALAKAGVPHEFHIFPGRHAESYWNSHLADYLRFYTQEWQNP